MRDASAAELHAAAPLRQGRRAPDGPAPVGRSADRPRQGHRRRRRGDVPPPLHGARGSAGVAQAGARLRRADPGAAAAGRRASCEDRRAAGADRGAQCLAAVAAGRLPAAPQARSRPRAPPADAGQPGRADDRLGRRPRSWRSRRSSRTAIPIRLTGEDVERGTFSQRHAVFHDASTGKRYIPLQALPQAQARLRDPQQPAHARPPRSASSSATTCRSRAGWSCGKRSTATSSTARRSSSTSSSPRAAPSGA